MVYDIDIYGSRNPRGYKKRCNNSKLSKIEVCEECDGEGECFIDPPQHGNHYLPCEKCEGTGEIEEQND